MIDINEELRLDVITLLNNVMTDIGNTSLLPATVEDLIRRLEGKELLPCPFCGSENVSAYDAHAHGVCFAKCNDCDCKIQATTRNRVIEKWNTRKGE